MRLFSLARQGTGQVVSAVAVASMLLGAAAVLFVGTEVLASPSAGASDRAAGADVCIVGRWRAVTLHDSYINLDTGEVDALTGDAGEVLMIDADGRFTLDYTNAAPATGVTKAGQPVVFTWRGTVSGHLRTRAGHIRNSSAHPALTLSVTIAGAPVASARITQFPAFTGQRYHCTGSGLRIAERLGDDIYTRLSAPPSSSSTASRANEARSSLPASFPDPTRVDTSAKTLAAAAALTALLMVMVAFPSELFDRTLKSHYRTVRGWFGPLARLDARVIARLRASPPWLVFSGFMVIGGLLAAALDPTLDWNLASLALVLGLVVSRAVITVAFTLPEIVFRRRREPLRARFEALPAALAVAGVCVLVSRLAGFQPGYLYGVIVGIEFARKLSHLDQGRVAAWWALWALVVGLVAWFAWIPVVDAISGGDSSFAILFVDAVLATLFVTAVEAVVIGLLPLRVLKGEALLAWSRRTWMAIYAMGTFLFVWVLVHPDSNFVGTTHESGQVTRALVPFLLFGVASLGFWLFLRNRPPSPLEPGVDDAPAAVAAGDHG